MLGNINIEAGESSYSQSSKSNSRNLGGSVGTNGLSANIGFSESKSSLDQTTFANSQISAINGNLNINTKQDLKIFGANLLSKNVNLNIGNNFLLKSRQNLLESDSYNIGASIGISGNSDGKSSGINGGSLGLNLGNGYSNRAFVDQASSIIGTNSVNINVANDTNITSALIANQNNQGIDLGNLNLKTKSLTYSDLNNFSVSESNQLSTNLQAGYNPNNPTQNGNLAIKLNMQGRESSSTTKATIGKGNITINEILNDESKIANLNREINNIEQNKKNIITSDFDSEIKIDLRLIASVGNLMIGDTDKAVANWNSYATQTVDGAKIAYKFTPTNVNKEIEKFRGSVQSWGWGNNAVYKSGDEPNGVRDEFANNVGMANVPIDRETGKVILEKIGAPVDFSDLLKQGIGAVIGNEGGLVSQACIYAVPGCNDMSLTHDNIAGQLKKNYPEIPTLITNQVTIIPAYIINSYGLIGKPINDFIEYLQTPSYTINLELPKNPIQIPTLLSPSFNQNLQQQ